jgi:CheY-like chemotaxis protein
MATSLRNCPDMQQRLLRHSQELTMQATQVAACNRLHKVDQRLARWLVMSQDRLGGDIVPLTQQSLAHMLGTRRASVTVAAGILQRAGLIAYNRGEVRIKNRHKLEKASCECYKTMKRQSRRWQDETKWFFRFLRSRSASGKSFIASFQSFNTIAYIGCFQRCCHLIRRYLGSESSLAVCGEASDGVEAIEKAQQLHPDLIVMDFSMPRMNGLEAASKIKQKMPDVPIILFTLHKSTVFNRHANVGEVSAIVCKSEDRKLLMTQILILLELD